ncbi:hypothetical protein FNH13_10555 [Ornithinimicrobium ciconiae]|uniref:MobA-like NTP transferase domain-containing protein n=1 Tax=Ornithinimicrobium ciconiae TaxID=2594265 RepID=A0A516GB04_9MICO|nr:NTP transferase domain-containing protein [Ornithinimicrobium ciconiae]QDO88714.1 hypothetical protein FNH13_10555 [Ornithinimicrobium ciconiae]
MAGSPTPHPIPEHDLIVLAGGGGSRLGGVDKAALTVGGRSLLDRVLEAAEAARRTVVVGAVRTPPGVLQTLEDPPAGGPVAGIAAGVAALAVATGAARSTAAAPWTLVIAVDQPTAAEAAPDLLTAAGVAWPQIDLVCPHDASGHPQWLLAAYRTASLRRALVPFGSGHGVSVRRLVAGLTIGDVDTGHQGDIDTWEDHAAWQERLSTPPDHRV